MGCGIWLWVGCLGLVSAFVGCFCCLVVGGGGLAVPSCVVVWLFGLVFGFGFGICACWGLLVCVRFAGLVIGVSGQCLLIVRCWFWCLFGFGGYLVAGLFGRLVAYFCRRFLGDLLD